MTGAVPEIGELAAEISRAHERLVATYRAVVAAREAVARYEKRARIDNADALLEARNERSMSLYLEGVLDTPEYAELSAAKTAAELEHYEARSEVDRLELTVRLLEATSRGRPPG